MLSSKLEILSAPMFITEQALQSYLFALTQPQPKDWVEIEIPTAKDIAAKTAEKLSEDTGIAITTDYGNTSLENAIAYYEAHGALMYDDYSWYFNTKTFVEDFLAAEANPAVMAHFLHINSGGGLAYYLEEVFKVLWNRKKPLIAQCEMYMCSAAAYLAAPADNIFATTQFDTFGSFGTMVSFWDLKPYFEKVGFKWHEYYAEQSTLKNKRFNDLLAGKPEDYIEKELNPVAAQFIEDMKKAFPKATGDGIFEGQTYYASEAVAMKMLCGIQPVIDSLSLAYSKGLKYLEKQDIHQYSLNKLS